MTWMLSVHPISPGRLELMCKLLPSFLRPSPPPAAPAEHIMSEVMLSFCRACSAPRTNAEDIERQLGRLLRMRSRLDMHATSQAKQSSRKIKC